MNREAAEQLIAADKEKGRALSARLTEIATWMHEALGIPRVIILACSAKADGANLIGAYVKGPEEISILLQRVLDRSDKAELLDMSPDKPEPS